MNTHSRRFALPLASLAIVTGTLAVAGPAQAASPTVTDFASLQSALSSCTDGDVVTVGADISNTGAIVTTGCTLTLDLGDRNVSVASVVIGLGTTLTIRGGAQKSGSLTAIPSDFQGAGIQTSGAALVVDSGRVTASGAADPEGEGLPGAAGIGGSSGGVGPTDAGSVTINGGTVTATAGPSSAAIGGGEAGEGGTVIINGGVVNATGITRSNSFRAMPGQAGIGGGDGGGGGTVVINGGAVDASGGLYAAGIGGGLDGDGGDVTIGVGARVTATGGEGGAGIGGGTRGDGGNTILEKGSDVTVRGGLLLEDGADVTAVGPGMLYGGTPDFGTLSVAGTMRIPTGANLTVPDGATVTVAATGVITGSTSSTDGGQIYGPGTIDNRGSIRLPANQVVDSTTPAVITDHYYAVTFDTQGGSAAPSPVTVFAESFAAGGRDFPSDPTKTGTEFRGWNSRAVGSGASITTSSPLPGSATGAPVPVTAYAQFAPPEVTPPAAPDASITGTVREGRTLTARTGLPAGAAATYRWSADGRTITGATGSTLKLGKKQAARRVTVTVTAGGRTSTSKATKVVTSERARIVVTPTRIGKRDYFSVTAVGLAKRQKIRVWLGGRRVLIGKADSRGVVDRTVRFSKATDAGKRRVRVSGYSKTDKRTFTVSRTVRYLSR